jgi:DNA repair exonuclease SbcCD ATPase subunit
MLISIKAKNFRKHRDLNLTLTSGLNALRGPNEHGKTTVIEIVLYAFFGTAALRESLADTVTWGMAEKELSVDVIFRCDSVLYQFTRSKAGAECNYEGGKVTGQKEVTAFAADLLGADAKTSAVLMMASQNGLRGALDEGPTAVSGLMSKLADFDLLDRILDAANSKLTLGAEAPLQQRLTAALRELEEAQASIPADVEKAIVELQSIIDSLQDEVERLSIAESGELHPAMQAAHSVLEAATLANQQRERVTQDLATTRSDILAEAGKLAKAEGEAAVRPTADEFAAVRERVARDNDHAKVADAYRRFLALPKPGDSVWDGDRDSLLAAVVDARKRRDELAEKLFAIQREVDDAKRGEMKAGKCPTCGHAEHSAEHIAAHNAAVAARVAEILKPKDALLAQRSEAIEEVDALEAVANAGTKFDAAVVAVMDYVEMNRDTVPATAKWIGEPPSAPTGQAAKDLAALDAKDRAAMMAQGRAEAHKTRIGELEAKVEKLTALQKEMPVHDLEPLSAAYDRAYATYMSNATVLRERRAVLDGERQRLNTLQTTLNSALAKVDATRRRVAETESDIKRLTFNNGLVKKLKMLKPMITDHLWNTVLAAVGTFFSQMRGEQSVVTKDKDGFKVNGQKINGLSGSTLDVLALAIRVALVKTFVPHATFMILDEPAHGCDTERTGNVLGFLTGVGFEQVLLASHDELSEAVADQVIALAN